MARLYTGGAEIELAAGPEYNSITGTVTRDTSTFRSGGAAFKCDSGAGGVTLITFNSGVSGGGLTYFLRAYMNFSSVTPASTIKIMHLGATTDIYVQLTTDSKLQLKRGDGGSFVQAVQSAPLSTGVWYRIEMSATLDGTATNFTDATMRLNGTTIATGSGFTEAAGAAAAAAGWIDSPGASRVVYVDDIALNNSSGANQNSWPGDGKVILMTPTSDSQRGSWTGGAGGTTNLWDAINNTPPIGTATETNLTQIENSDSSPDNATDEYRGDCGSYLTAGVGASDTINTIHALCNHGEDVTTNTKTGSFGFQANPAVAYHTFAFGNDAGALGTYPSLWSWDVGAVQYAPSVTIGSSLILAARKTDTGTRVGSICFLGAYVDYTPAASGNTYTKAGYGKESG